MCLTPHATAAVGGAVLTSACASTRLADMRAGLRCVCGAQPAATRLLQAVAAQCGEGAGASGDANQAAEQAAALNNADMSTSCAPTNDIVCDATLTLLQLLSLPG